MDRVQDRAHEHQRIADAHPGGAAGEHQRAGQSEDDRQHRPFMDRYSEDTVDDRCENDEQAGDEACVAGAGRGHPDRLEQVAARKNGACSRADRELAAGGHAAHKGGHDQGGQQEPELEEGQGRVLCDRVLDQDERPAPDRGDHHQQEDVDQWSDCGRHGA